MPLEAPVLDDRNFEELLEEAKRRIPVHTPEWTNFDVESDPGITLVQVFSFLTDSLLYRANRVPDLNRIKFLQLLDVPLQPAAAARGIVSIRNDRGPLQALPLDTGVIVSAGNVNFLTRDGVNILPVEARIYYKRTVSSTDERMPEFLASFAAVQAAEEAALAESLGESVSPGSAGNLQFYETMPLAAPTPGAPNPVLDVAQETLDGLYIALLAPANVALEAVRPILANQVLSIGVAPALSDTIPPLQPLRTTSLRQPVPTFIVEMPDPISAPTTPRYRRLQVIEHPDVFNDLGVIQVKLPDVAGLQTWSFSEPFEDGVGGLPPRIEDEQIQNRIVTWVRLRLPANDGAGSETGVSKARVTWVGINAARVNQAIPVTNEPLGTGNGEPDQELRTATTPVIPDSVRLEVETEADGWQRWRLTDDLLAAQEDDEVFTLDPEAGLIRFGDGLRGVRPPLDARVRISYEYGGGAKGNVAIGAINRTGDVRLQAGYKVSNPIATYGGDDGETVEEGERNIPLYLRHRDRLVTASDFRNIVERTPGVDVGRVEILSLYNPTATPREPAPGNVTIMVIPATDAVRPGWPIPDRLFLRTVCDYVAPRRLVTTEIHARGPEYISVYISVGIQVRDGHFQDVVNRAVDQRLHEYLSALPPGGPDETGWPLNRQLLAKDLEAVVTRVSGVEFVEGLEMGVNGTLTPVTEPYPLAGLELPYLAALTVTNGSPEPLANLVQGTENSLPADLLKPVPVSRAKC